VNFLPDAPAEAANAPVSRYDFPLLARAAWLGLFPEQKPSKTRECRMRIRYFLSFFLMAAASLVALAADADGAAKARPETESASNSYIGEGLRIGAGYDTRTKLRGEYYQVLQEDAARALIGEAWVSGSAAGFKLNQHWLPQSESQPQSVRKMFIAIDQNEQRDRKFTIGGGAEYASWNWGGYLSHSITGRRQISSDTTSLVENIPGTENGRSYFQEVTTATTTRIFERAYDYGIGLMAGHFYEPALLRVYARIDHEWGRSSASQNTLGFGVEKFFADSPVSLALNAEAYRKSGDFESKQNDQRVNLVLRYEFGGKSFRPAREARQVAVIPASASADVATAPPTASTTPPLTGSVTTHDSSRKTEQRMVKTTASMSADAFFEFDKATITPAARTALAEVVARLKSSGYTGNILLTGHTCDIGAAGYNLKLSQRRASAVRDYMAAEGVPADTILVEGKGEAEPRYPNDSSASRRKNRRVDLEFVAYVDKMEEVLAPNVGKPAEIARPGSVAAKPVPADVVEWRTEYIENEPAWLRRALHNTIRHKQTVDVYRQVEQSTTVTNGARTYVNRIPVAADDAYSVPRNSSGNLFDVLKNDSDPDNDPLRILSVKNPAHGTATISGNRVSYTPSAGYSGPDSFTYTITDDRNGTATATVSVTVTFVNSAPVAVNDDFSLTRNSSKNLLDVLKNDSDPDGDALRILSVQNPAHGTATISGNRVAYTPSAGYAGADSFGYTITDDKGGTATATVSVTISFVNSAPVAVNDVFQVARNSASNSLDVLKNDSDPDGDALRILSVQNPAHGTASISGSRVVYTPSAGYAGADSFGYTITDDKGGTASATVSITVSFVNSAPVAVNDAFQVVRNSSNNLFDVLKNDSDPDGDPLNIASVQSAAHGQVSINANRVAYTPAAGYVGADSFTYTISDNQGLTATATVSVTVTGPANTPPVAVDDESWVIWGQPIRIYVLNNDYDPDGDPLTITSIGPVANGRATITGNNITYTSNPTFTGREVFTYTISDGRGGTATATVRVTVVDP
jgi:outer membrane protein OmpA-like peptidoglycan-associated protein/acyl-CoA thioesterase FadM